MIDTDKYEGHTEGPWTIDVHKVGKDISAIVIESNMTTHTNCVLAEVEVENKYAEVDAQLIADAPLILQALIDKQEEYTRFTLYAQAEIKRLRDAIDEIANEIEAAELGYASTYVVRNPYTSKDVLQPRKIFEDLRKVILQ